MRKFFLFAFAFLNSILVNAQTYPSRPFTLIVPSAPGGLADVTARPFAAALAKATGQSFVVDPSGQIISKASVADEEILITEVDLDALDTQRTHWPFFRDRRIDAYAEITKRLVD